MSNPNDDEIEIDLTKAVEVLNRYAEDVHPSQNYIQASVEVSIRRQPNDYFVMHLKCDSQDLQMMKVEKFEADRERPLNVTKNWKLNPLVKARFREIRDAVRKEAGRRV